MSIRGLPPMNHKELRALCRSLGDQSDMCGKLAGETEALLDKMESMTSEGYIENFSRTQELEARLKATREALRNCKTFVEQVKGARAGYMGDHKAYLPQLNTRHVDKLYAQIKEVYEDKD